jgi:hypothetical protein
MISIPEKSGGCQRLCFHADARPGSYPLGSSDKDLICSRFWRSGFVSACEPAAGRRRGYPDTLSFLRKVPLL